MAKRQVVVVMENADGGISIRNDGRPQEYYSDAGYLASQYIDVLNEFEQLRSEIAKHISWMNSRTPEQVNRLDAGTLRAIAAELKFNCGLAEESR
jgi:hypothetical protein